MIFWNCRLFPHPRRKVTVFTLVFWIFFSNLHCPWVFSFLMRWCGARFAVPQTLVLSNLWGLFGSWMFLRWLIEHVSVYLRRFFSWCLCGALFFSGFIAVFIWSVFAGPLQSRCLICTIQLSFFLWKFRNLFLCKHSFASLEEVHSRLILVAIRSEILPVMPSVDWLIGQNTPGFVNWMEFPEKK